MDLSQLKNKLEQIKRGEVIQQDILLSLSPIAAHLDTELKSRLKSAGHYKSGQLEAETLISATDKGLKIHSFKYLILLDNGAFMKDFKTYLTEYLASALKEDIGKSIIKQLK